MKILVAVDGSKASRRAAELGIELATGMGAELFFTTVVKPGRIQEIDAGHDHWSISTADRGEARLREFIEEMQPGLKYQATATSGKPEKQIKAEAERLGADLLVLGSDHIKGVKRVLGSVAADLLHHPPCSIVVAK